MSIGKYAPPIAALCVLLWASRGGAAERGLAAYYPLDEGTGGVARDRSGHDHHGTIHGNAKWARASWGTALVFDGQGVYVDCGADKGLDISGGGTVSVWCRPERLQGGIVNWSTGGAWADERLVLAINTYHGDASLMGCLADGRGFQRLGGFGEIEVGQWTHLAITFDGDTVRLYRDGLIVDRRSQGLTPALAGVPLWIGRCLGLGRQWFHGLIDEVRIYDRPLSAREMLVLYKRQAVDRGKDTAIFRRPAVAARPYPDPGKVLIELDVRAMQPLPAGARLRVAVRRADDATPVAPAATSAVPAGGKATIAFDLAKVSPGTYRLNASVRRPDGSLVGEESSASFVWPGQTEGYRGIRILNNLVWELLDLRQPRPGRTYTFTLPVDRWVFVRSSAWTTVGASAKVVLDAAKRGPTIVVHSGEGRSTHEAMRFLRAGPHTLSIVVQGAVQCGPLVVRAIPELQHAFYGADPHIHPYGPYDWSFLSQDVLPNVTTMISGGSEVPPELEGWTRSGRRWITITGVPRPETTGEAAVEEVYRQWSRALGIRHPLMAGIIMDEFGGGDSPIYDVYRKAVERILADPEYANKRFLPYGYGGSFSAADRSTAFAKVCIASGGYICLERYLPEAPTRAEAEEAAVRAVAEVVPRFEKALPGVTRHLVIVYGYMSQPTESLNVRPDVSFRVFMDIEMHTLATHPALFGIGGVQYYHSSYADEENVRWAGRLYRHYCIEGRTEPLASDPYRLAHLDNPDFAEGLVGWRIEEAEPGSAAIRKYPGYSWLEGRYPRTSLGDQFLCMRRSARGPNRFSQRIVGLEPGRLYSLKMITGDYQDLIHERSEKRLHAVSIDIEGVDSLADPKRSFQFPFPNCYAHQLGKFDRHYRYWMNYHWRVFRARSDTARLTVSDWASPTSPGGPIGRQLMFNFIEVQPYLGQ